VGLEGVEPPLTANQFHLLITFFFLLSIYFYSNIVCCAHHSAGGIYGVICVMTACSLVPPGGIDLGMVRSGQIPDPSGNVSLVRASVVVLCR
jgi:hypothetical protein